MKLLIIIFLSLMSLSAYGEQSSQIIVDGGVGVAHSADYGLPETKMLTVGEQEDLWGPLMGRAIVGGYLDNAGNRRRGSGLISGQLGFEVNRNGLLGGIFSGPCLISSPDNVLLGGYLEFMEDLHLGIQDNDNNYIGLYYRHISDAGLTQTNVGRDIVGVELRW